MGRALTSKACPHARSGHAPFGALNMLRAMTGNRSAAMTWMNAASVFQAVARRRADTVPGPAGDPTTSSLLSARPAAGGGGIRG